MNKKPKNKTCPSLVSFTQILTQTEQRAFPYPARPWVTRQLWDDLLFLNYALPVADLQAQLPPGLKADTFDGQAWLSIVPFQLSLNLRGLPEGFWPIRFPELNVRTYVTLNGVPGVYFYSLDCTDWFSVGMARAWLHLPYFPARIPFKATANGAQLKSSRTLGPQPSGYQAHYQATGPVSLAKPGSFEQFITERWCFFSEVPGQPGLFVRGDVHHEPWPLQPARYEEVENQLLIGHGFRHRLKPHSAYYSKRVHVFSWNKQLVQAEALT